MSLLAMLYEKLKLLNLEVIMYVLSTKYHELIEDKVHRKYLDFWKLLSLIAITRDINRYISV